MLCPYYDSEYKRCNLSGCSQDQSQRDYRCLDSNNWKSCPNYENSSLEQKVSKRLRTNPDL